MLMREIIFVGLKSSFVTCGKIPIILNGMNKILCKVCIFAILVNIYFSVICKSLDSV